MNFYFLSQEKVFESSYNCLLSSSLLCYLNPDTFVYLFEPSSSLTEPAFDLNPANRMYSTCSPNQVRYKEFCKSGPINIT